jgi:hypothetical protein
MKYALNIDADGRVLSATFPQYAPKDAVTVDALPKGNLADYRYVSGKFVHDPLPVPEEPAPAPTAQDDIDALMVDHEYRLTLLELGLI